MDDGSRDKITKLIALGQNQTQRKANLKPVKELFLTGKSTEPFEPKAGR
ncbi:MAG: hypothetical protein ABJQ71_13675 [Roseibium sp.]